MFSYVPEGWGKSPVTSLLITPEALGSSSKPTKQGDKEHAHLCACMYPYRCEQEHTHTPLMKIISMLLSFISSTVDEMSYRVYNNM